MASRRGRRPGRLLRLAERAVLGAVLGLAVLVLERRLRKALGAGTRKSRRGRTAELG